MKAKTTKEVISDIHNQLASEEKNIVLDSILISIEAPRLQPPTEYLSTSVVTQKITIEFMVYANESCSFTRPYIDQLKAKK